MATLIRKLQDFEPSSIPTNMKKWATLYCFAKTGADFRKTKYGWTLVEKLTRSEVDNGQLEKYLENNNFKMDLTD